jgi:hypothetical protein
MKTETKNKPQSNTVAVLCAPAKTKKPAYPCMAWRVMDCTDRHLYGRVHVARVIVLGRRGETATCRLPPCGADFECPITQLASTRHKALKRLNTLLSAIEIFTPEQSGDAA